MPVAAATLNPRPCSSSIRSKGSPICGEWETKSPRPRCRSAISTASCRARTNRRGSLLLRHQKGRERMSSTRRAFVIMPFGKKTAADGTVIDFDAVYRELLAPAITAAGLLPHRADADRRGGSIHADMFQDLLLAEFVVARPTTHNP